MFVQYALYKSKGVQFSWIIFLYFWIDDNFRAFSTTELKNGLNWPRGSGEEIENVNNFQTDR